MRSVRVVLPESMWAEMPMLRRAAASVAEADASWGVELVERGRPVLGEGGGEGA